ncbi:MAG: PEGA domain-containing protein [Ignavibacteriales bacterium]|nr:MAG: PEGA domain-containing protein [Ignavibacteriales bacterium]
MKKLFLILMLGVLGVFISSCESTDDPVTPAETGSVFISSTPSGAQIWVHGVDSGKVTPNTISNLSAGTHQFTLKLAEFLDTTFSITVVANQTQNPSITLNEALNYTVYQDTIWETVGTSASQPSGLDLSTGMAYGVSSANKMDVDIYYSSNGFLVQSANLNTTNGLTRVTQFRAGTSGTLSDGTNSPLVSSGTWTNNVGDRETNYFFLYDDDGHYSKAKITAFGGGTPGNPAFVVITWWYNNAANFPRF